jgi:hypothetical protein
VKHRIQLMMEAASTSKTAVNFYQTTRINISEDSHLQCFRYLRRLFGHAMGGGSVSQSRGINNTGQHNTEECRVQTHDPRVRTVNIQPLKKNLFLINK